MRRLTQLVLILAVVSGLAALPAIANPTAPMGVVVGAQGATVSQLPAIDGTTIYDGDVLMTGATGALRVRIGDGQLLLSSNSTVTIHKTNAGVTATLVAGMVRFAIVPGSSFDVRALEAVIVTAKNDQPANGQLSVLSPTSFHVGATKGDLDVNVNGTDTTVSESQAYRVNLDDASAGSGGSNGQTRGAGKSKGVWIIDGLIIAGTAVAIFLAFMSPSK